MDSREKDPTCASRAALAKNRAGQWNGAILPAMALDWSRCAEVTRSVMSGAWVFKGTRLTVATLFDNLNDGMTLEEVFEQFPSATLTQMQAVLEFASRSLDHQQLAS